MKQLINWKIFGILLVLSLVSILCILPYVLTVQGETIRRIGVPLEALFVAQFVQSILLFSVSISVGLLLAHKVGFRLPLLEAVTSKGDSKKELGRIGKVSVLSGIGVALSIYGVDALFGLLGVGISTHAALAPWWQTMLAAVYGGVSEEIIMRLFLMTLLTWIGMKIFGRKQPAPVGIWIAIVVAAIIFGLGHLPITASLTALTPLVVTRAVILNGIGGVVFGWLFWKKRTGSSHYLSFHHGCGLADAVADDPLESDQVTPSTSSLKIVVE